jgi:rhodanese-related sulfurtransferase
MDGNEKNNNKIFLVGIALIALVFAFTFFKPFFYQNKSKEKNYQQEVLNYPKISPEDLKNKIKNNNDTQILDIRSTDDYAMEHLIDSVNANSEESINAIPKEKTIVMVGYSTKDEEYTKIVDYLKSNSYKNFFILKGGIDAWKNIGGSTISIGNPNSFTDASKVIYISPDDLKKIVDNKSYPKYIIDIRSKQLFDSGHILEAENILLDDLEKSKDKIPYGKEIFVYGDTELQGFQCGVRLHDLGFLSVKTLQGGLMAWKDKGFEAVK